MVFLCFLSLVGTTTGGFSSSSSSSSELSSGESEDATESSEVGVTITSAFFFYERLQISKSMASQAN